MRNRVRLALVKIKKLDGLLTLKECSNLEERYEKLVQLLPEIRKWDLYTARQELYFYLQNLYDVDMGVCEYFFIDDHQTFCVFDEVKQECICSIPQTFCIIRDRQSIPSFSIFERDL